ncbi:MAG: frataxin domain-containing protein [Pseudomonadota bacterium]|nr:frataxin domain-containing protein [Pseudomonadota bacterium]
MNNFKKSADKTLNLIFDMIEKDYDYLDVDFEEENLRIEIDKRVFILSIHNPTSQIWLSSPLSGAHHFELEIDTKKWIGTRDKNLNLIEMLKIELDSLK